MEIKAGMDYVVARSGLPGPEALIMSSLHKAIDGYFTELQCKRDDAMSTRSDLSRCSSAVSVHVSASAAREEHKSFEGLLIPNSEWLVMTVIAIPYYCIKHWGRHHDPSCRPDFIVLFLHR